MSRDIAAEMNPDMIFFDGLDEALIGVVERPGMHPVACYSYRKMVLSLVVGSDMSMEEAEEYLDHNTLCVNLGEHTPVVLWD